MSRISEPSPSTLARTDASKRSFAVARTDSLTTTPTRRATNGATHTIGWLPKPAMRAPASTTLASTRCGAILTLATRSPRSTICPSKTVNTSSGIEPVDPLELGDPDRDDPIGRRDQVEPALIGAAHLEARSGDRLGEAQRRLVLVQLVRRRRSAPLTGGPGSAAASASRSSADQPPTLRPALAADRQVAGEDRARQPAGRAPTRDDPLDAHRPDA